jgi:hypothetical protein
VRVGGDFGLCPVGGFGFSGLEPLGSLARELCMWESCSLQIPIQSKFLL